MMKKINQWRISALLMVIILIFVFFYFNSKHNPTSRYSICIKYYKEQYASLIIDISKGELRKPIYVLRNKAWFSPYFNKDSVEVILQLGDSIYKPSKSFDLYIYKKANPDSVIYLPYDFDCNSLVEKD